MTKNSLLVFICLILLSSNVSAQKKLLSKSDILELSDQISTEMNKSYVFPEKVSPLREGLKSWVNGLPEDLSWDGAFSADTLTQVIQSFIPDGHLRIRYNPEAPQEDEQRRPSTEEMFNMLNNGIMEVSLKAEGIGYIDLRAFDNRLIAQEKAEAAFRIVQNTDALIIDLRRNVGGAVPMVQRLCSYLIHENVKLNSVYNRLTNTTADFYTLSDSTLTRYDKDKPIFLLTSSSTFSGGEEFAYNLKHMGRATLIGEATGGGAHPTRPFELENDFLLFVPFARSINPITGTNWEGVGVQPHINISAENALERAKEEIIKMLG